MYQALYRKYRPDSFAEVYGQDIIKQTLLNQIKENKISHAYLFCGPRGTGKTSIAKIISKIVNCHHLKKELTCNKCPSCISFQEKSFVDVIEIDAASNNGVDEIRELRSKVNLLPAVSKYKIYIIDEVHMLSIGAFNALLKTLEEPPQHVIFILATTEVNKIPDTIVSRCQRFDFKRISEEYIYKRLLDIVEKEKINITDDALIEISKLTKGGMRDSIGLLDKVSSYTDEKITPEIVHLVNCSLPKKELESLFLLLYNNDINGYIEFVNELKNKGIEISIVVDELMHYVRDLLLKKIPNSYNESILLKYINSLNDLSGKIKVSVYPKILFETFIVMANSGNAFENNALKQDVKSNVLGSNNPEKVQVNVVDLEKDEKNNTITIEGNKNISQIEELVELRINNTLSKCNKTCLNDAKNKWNKISSYSVDVNYSMIAGMLLDGELVAVSTTHMIATYPYAAMSKRANESIPLIEELLEKIFETKIMFVAIDQKEWNVLKKKYIEKLKKNESYNYIEEIVDYDQVFRNDATEVVEQAVELFGTELIQIV